ncbi:hypothetical protein [Bradyrhizobium ottawaense]|uniref:hypothetical protein n=1 Tax=Bradyrhizobium ottawaense TaxID=931866 RepID=UPI003FA145F6
MSDDDQANDNPFGKFSMHGSQQQSYKTSLSDATKFARVLLGSYDGVEVHDPEVFVAAVIRIFRHFSTDVLRQVCDPSVGLPVKLKWFPKLFEIKAECNAVSAEFAHRERLKNWGKSIAPPENREGRPTIDELKAKYGPNWGILQEEKLSSAVGGKPDFKCMTKKQLSEHYKKYGLGYSTKSPEKQTGADTSSEQRKPEKARRRNGSDR